MRALWIRFIEPRHQSFVRDDLFIAHCVVATTNRIIFYLNQNDNCEFMMMANLFFCELYQYASLLFFKSIISVRIHSRTMFD